jgi:coenzyme F420 hydrogenase subunit delta
LNEPELRNKRVVVLGCGNVLFGDDGFGPAVVEHLIKNYKIPPDVGVMDAGTGVREILFDIILSEKKPQKIIIVDGLDLGKSPGEIFVIPPEQMPGEKVDDFSMHQIPTSNLLKELEMGCRVEVVVVAGQVENIPATVSAGLSKKLVDAVPKACDAVVRLCTSGA